MSGIRQNRVRWSAKMKDTLARLYPTTPTRALAQLLGVPMSKVYAQAMRMGLRKSEAFYAVGHGGRIVIGGTLGVQTRFQSGNEPWNKGRKGWQAGGRSTDTQFATGMQPPNTLPVGSLRITRCKGIPQLERKIGTASGPNHLRWKAVHRLVWEAAHGPTPPGCIIVFKPGMKTLVEAEITLDRVECITRAENVRRNDIRTKNPELGKLYQLKGAITRQINRITEEANKPS